MSAESDRLRACRIVARLSQRQLAKRANLSAWAVGEIERGYRRPTTEEKEAIGKVLVSSLGGTIRDIFPSFVPRYHSVDHRPSVHE